MGFHSAIIAVIVIVVVVVVTCVYAFFCTATSFSSSANVSLLPCLVSSCLVYVSLNTPSLSWHIFWLCALRRCLTTAVSLHLLVQSFNRLLLALPLLPLSSSTSPSSVSRLPICCFSFVRLLVFRCVYFISYLIRFRLGPSAVVGKLRSHQNG